MSFCEACSDELGAQSLGFSVLTKQHACSFQGSLRFTMQGTFRIIITCLCGSRRTVQAPWKLGANHFLSATFGPRTRVSTQRRISKSAGECSYLSQLYSIPLYMPSPQGPSPAHSHACPFAYSLFSLSCSLFPGFPSVCSVCLHLLHDLKHFFFFSIQDTHVGIIFEPW